MILKPLSLADLEQIRRWRNQLMPAWRTPYMLTEKMQEDFYTNVVNNRQSNMRLWGFWAEEKWAEIFIGDGGIENISLENRTGEISILIGPDYRGRGYGAEAIRLILKQGFDVLNLDVVWAECYLCNESIAFWKKMARQYQCEEYQLPYRKFWEGRYWPAMFFYFVREICKPLL